MNQVLRYIDNCDDINALITILEASAHKSQVNTISETARLDGKSPNGVRDSKNWKKIFIGIQVMTFPRSKGLRDTNFPF